MRLRLTLFTAVWFGMLFGLMEGAAALALQHACGVVMRAPPSILWIAPAFNTLVAIALGAGIAVLPGVRLPERIRLLSTLLIWIGLFTLLYRLQWFHQVAILILTLGASVEVGRRLRRHLSGWTAFQRKTMLPLLVVVVLAGGLGGFWPTFREWRLRRALPDAEPNAPNVLLLVADTLRADHLSCYGYPRPTTPNIDALAGQGVLFERAIANSSWTLPSHASMLTGRLPREHQADWRRPMNRTYTTLGEALAARGYATAAFAANRCFVAPEWGLDRGFSRFEVYGPALGDLIAGTVIGRKLQLNVLPRLGCFDVPGRKDAAEVNREFLRWQEKVADRPFFALLNYMDVHDPYLPPAAPAASAGRPPATRGDVVNFQFQAHAFRRKATIDQAEIESEIAGYDACLEYLDAQVGILLAELEKRGLAKNTLVIVVSDHGEAFGDHSLFGHGNSLYLETLHVPLICVWPQRIPAGRRVPEVVGPQRIPATVMDLLGDGGEAFPGASLALQWRGRSPRKAPEAVVSEVSGVEDGPAGYPTSGRSLRSLVTERWHLIVGDAQEMELYDWWQDPRETQNLAQSPEAQESLAGLLRRLREQVGE